MADNIGTLVPTLIPALGEEANIQEALRLYHYGDEEYNPSNPTASLLPSIGIARYIKDLQDAVSNLETTTGIQESEITAKGDLLVGTAFEEVGVLSLPTSPSPEGYVLTVRSAETTGLKWEPVQVTLSGSEILENKTLTLPRIVSGGGITDSSNDFRRYVTFNTVPLGVNHITITNAVAASGPIVGVTGSTNVDLNLAAAGTGKVKVGGSEVVTLTETQTLTNKTLTAPKLSGQSGTTAGALGYLNGNIVYGDGSAQRVLTTTDSSQIFSNKSLTSSSTFITNGTNTIAFAPSSNNVTLTAPTASGTLVTESGNQVLSNKSLDETTQIKISSTAPGNTYATVGTLFNSKANTASPTFTGTVTIPNDLVTRSTGLFLGGVRVFVGSSASGATTGDIWIRTS